MVTFPCYVNVYKRAHDTLMVNLMCFNMALLWLNRDDNGIILGCQKVMGVPLHLYNVGPPCDSFQLVQITTIPIGFMVVIAKAR